MRPYTADPVGTGHQVHQGVCFGCQPSWRALQRYQYIIGCSMLPYDPSSSLWGQHSDHAATNLHNLQRCILFNNTGMLGESWLASKRVLDHIELWFQATFAEKIMHHASCISTGKKSTASLASQCSILTLQAIVTLQLRWSLQQISSPYPPGYAYSALCFWGGRKYQ